MGLGILALLLVSMLPYPALAESARDIARQTFPSVVLLILQDAGGQPVSLGSGFFVTPDTVATNLHVIRGASSGYVKLVGQKAKLDIAGISAIDEAQDLALLKISRASATPLPLAADDSVSIGDTVYAVGNPEGLEGTFSQGIISGLRKLDDGNWLQLTAPLSPGSSGGPILDSSGKVVGVAVATFSDGQNLNFAVPASRIRRLLSQRSDPMPLASISAPSSTTSTPVEAKATDGVIIRNLDWKNLHSRDSEYVFSIRNNLRESITDILYVTIFYDAAGEPIHSTVSEYTQVVPPLLAKMVEISMSHPSYPGDGVRRMTERMEMRILDYRIAKALDASSGQTRELEQEKSKRFLAENARRRGVKVTASGLQYQILRKGQGRRPDPQSTVVVHYRGKLIDGQEFDSSYPGDEPVSILLDHVIPGWTEGLQLMQAGAKYRFFIPPELAYGERGAGTRIKPGQTLIFDIELLRVK